MPNGRITRSIGSRSPGTRPGGGSRLKTRRQAERAKETPVTNARLRRSRAAIRASCRGDSSEGESDIADLGSHRRAQTQAGALSWRSLRKPLFNGNVGSAGAFHRPVPLTASLRRPPGAPKRAPTASQWCTRSRCTTRRKSPDDCPCSAVALTSSVPAGGSARCWWCIPRVVLPVDPRTTTGAVLFAQSPLRLPYVDLPVCIHYGKPWAIGVL